MSDWRKTCLGDLAVFTNGFAFGPAHWGTTGLPIIRIEQMLRPDAPADYYDGPIPDHHRIDTGDLLMSWSGTIDLVRWDRGPALVNQHLFKIEPKRTIDNRFLYHVLQSSLADLSSGAHGTTMRHIKRGDLVAYEVLNPPLEEQARIAEVLDTVDDKIKVTKRMIAKLEYAREAAVHAHLDAVTDVATSPRNPLGDLVTSPVCYGIVQPGRHVPDGVPMVAIRDLRSDFTQLHKVAKKLDEQYARSRVQEGDVLVSVKATIGRTAVVPNGFTGNISRDVARLRPRRDLVAGYLEILLRSSKGQDLLRRAVVGTTRAEVSIGILARLEVPLPALEAQHRVVAVDQAFNERIVLEMATLAKTRQLQAAVCTDLLSARVRTVVA